MLPVYVKSFDISFAVASLAIILYQGGGMAITFPTGYLLDRIGRRPILLTGPYSAGTFFSIDCNQPRLYPSADITLHRWCGGADVDAEPFGGGSRISLAAASGGGRLPG